MLRMATVEPRLMNGLQEAVLLLCKAGLKFESTLSVNGLLAITVDQKDVFLVNFKQTIGDSEGDTIEANYSDSRPTENMEISAGSSTNDLELNQRSKNLTAISDNCVQRQEQRNANVESSQDDTFDEGRCVAEDPCSDEVVLAKESNQRPRTFRRHAVNLIKRPPSLPLPKKCKEQRVNFSSGRLHSSSNLEYTAEEVKRLQRDELGLQESRFDMQRHGIKSGISNIECAVATSDIDYDLLCKIKQEPQDESHFTYQVSHPLETLSQSEIRHEEPKDYSQFSAHHSYSMHHLLQSQAAASDWSLEAQSTLARTSSLHRNITSTAANWPRRQIRSSDKSVCVNCGTNTTTVWRRGKEGQLLCNACGCYYKLHKTNRPQCLMKDNIRRRSRRHQGLHWAKDALPAASPHNLLPFPLGWMQQNVEQS